MHAQLYARLCGWLLIVFGLLGFLVGGIGDYMRFTPFETYSYLTLGFICIWGARQRHRYAAVMSLFVGLCLLALGGLSIASILPTNEPLENIFQIVLGAWGLYISVQDVLIWRRLPSQLGH